MNTNDFNSPITAGQLNESMFKKFGTKINFAKYTRENLENYRNLLRTKLNQSESTASFNDLLTNETYQRDKFMLSVLNSRIKEMLGESIAVMERAVKTAKAKSKSKPDFLDMDKDGNKTEPFKKAVADKKIKEAAIEEPAVTRKAAGKKFPLTLKDLEADKDKHTSSAAGLAAAKKKAGIDKPTNEAAPSAGMTAKQKSAVVKKAKAGQDLGKPGKGFEKVAKAAGGGEKGTKIAAAAMWKQQAKKIKESVEYLILENEEDKAQIISAGIDMVQDFTSWMQRIGSYQTKTTLEMSDDIRSQFGQDKAEEFKNAVSPALASAMETLTGVREQLTTAIAVLTGEAEAQEPMGAEPDMGVDDMSAEPDGMNMPPEDDFMASDAATGGAETAGRARRESREHTYAYKLQEAHNLLTKLSK